MVSVKESISHFQKALEISEANKLPVWRIKANNSLGWAYRINGDLERAQEYYQEARHLFWKEGGPDNEELRNDYGWISNNLTFVLSNRNETRRKAIDIARSTLEYWKSIGNDIGLGAGYLVLGIAYYRSDIADLGLEAFQKALDIFEPLRHNDWLGQIYSWRGALYQDMGKNDEKWFENAERDLTKSLEIGSSNIEAMTLNRLGRVYMSQHKWDVAQEKLIKSLERAQKIPDYKYWLSSIGRLAAIAAVKGEYERFEYFDQMFQDSLKKIEHPEENAKGVACINLAKLAFRGKDPKIDTIIDYLKEGISLVTEFGSYARTDILTRLPFIENDFDKINPEIIGSVGKALQKYISEQEIRDVAYSAVTPIMYRWANWKKEEVTDE